MEDSRNGWAEWGKYVLKELDRQNDCNTYLTEAVNSIRVDIVMLKMKCTAFGLIAGAVPGAILAIITYLKK